MPMKSNRTRNTLVVHLTECEWVLLKPLLQNYV
jgi:hypothetical protein